MSKAKKKKKRKNPKRHRRRAQLSASLIKDQTFDPSWTSLTALFCRFAARDVYVSLLSSQLWLPNLSAQVKHYLAITIFASIDADQFSPERHIDSYDSFRDFLLEVHSHLPPFPTLEDYEPEPDWGEIKSVTSAGTLRVFYGSSSERITDFIDAFRMRHVTGSAELQDMDSVLMLQDRLLSLVAQPASKAENSADFGSLHIPAEDFWQQCRSALPALSELAGQRAISPELVLRQGQPGMKMTHQDFGNAVASGTVLPYALLDMAGELLPVSPRDAASMVIQFWDQRSLQPSRLVEQRVAASLALYIKGRIRRATVGPYRIALRDGKRSFLEVPAILVHESSLWMIAVVSKDRLAELDKIENALQSIFGQYGAVIAMDLSINDLVVFKPATPDDFDPTSVKLIVVIAQSSTVSELVRVPRSSARKLFLADFISITSAVNDARELASFFDFVDTYPQARTSFIGPVDLFAVFKQSHGMLIEGAIEPTMIFLDPHSGSNWRYEQQKLFWQGAPAKFPDDDPTTWKLDPQNGSDGLLRMTSRADWRLAWTAELANASVHFMLDATAQALTPDDGNALEIFIHCLADSLNQRKNLLPTGLLRRRVVTHCLARENSLQSQVRDKDNATDTSLLIAWEVFEDIPKSLVLRIEVDLIQVRNGLMNSKDSRFEAASLAAWVSGLAKVVGIPLAEGALQLILDTGDRLARFTMSEMLRPVDVPDHTDPALPSPSQFKAARRELAVIFEKLGTRPGRYELADAKAVIDPARDAYRDLVHQKIDRFARTPLILFAIEQFDALVADYDRRAQQLKMSLTHEVDFDRQGGFAKIHNEFITNVRNYRYLLELVHSSCSMGHEVPNCDAITSLVAEIDWLMVLYGASDTLHNAIDVGGIELNSSFVPEVFYASESNEAYDRELADERLGAGKNSDDISSLTDSEARRLDEALLLDAGFTLTHLLHALVVLSRWPSVTGRPDDLKLSYRAADEVLVAELTKTVQDMTEPVARKVVEFLTLDPQRVRLIVGRDITESDVPIWEHRKRDHRYSIRPLIRLDDGRLAWGAAATSRAHSIWAASLSEGYPPADLPWPHVEEMSASIKRRVELELETRAFEICQRHAARVQHGINFKHRFPKESYEDVGDYDVLAYCPERNLWLTIECKFNKPAFSLKDARRLREYIFGKAISDGHIGKIDRRRQFLADNTERLRTLLGWPAPSVLQTTIIDLYVCPRIFYWMRRPPYPTNIEFVRLGMLDTWIQSTLSELPRSC
ncbi:MAG TPA: hypothetical protein VJL61_12035 [Rhodanobacteraceae bacterium]|nr:hypothetical protein [Rhodanobacteraceae bacterium]